MRSHFIAGTLCFMTSATTICCAFIPSSKVTSFLQSIPSSVSPSSIKLRPNKHSMQNCEPELGEFHPFLENESYSLLSNSDSNPYSLTSQKVGMTAAASGAATAAFITAFQNPSTALAESKLSTGDFNPDTFRPVCPTSDGFYRFLQGSTEAIVGEEQFVEYGPLIAGGLLRVRLELCVVESFFNEAVGPFIKQNGLTWILPIHETVETFLAGTIFALATTFILVGSTKIVSVVITYGDVFLGGPMRLLGGFFFDRARGKPVTLDIGVGTFKKRLVGPPVLESEGGWKKENEKRKEGESLTDILESLGKLDLTAFPLVALSGTVKGAGESSKFLRDVIEALDLFVGRYLVLIATGYIGVKFIHYKIFPDFPPF